MDVSFGFADYLLFFVGTMNFVLAIFIFINAPKNKINISFGIFAFFLTLWTLTLFLFKNVAISQAALMMRLIYISGLSIAVSLWYFVHIFPKKYVMSKNHKRIVLSILIIISILILVPGVIVKDVFISPAGGRSIHLNNIGYYLFFIPFVFFYGGSLFLLWKRMKATKKISKRPIILLFFGLLMAVVFGSFFNIILPSPFFQNFDYIHLGPPFTMGIVVAVAYGIARYQLMNIKVLVTEVLVIMLIVIQMVQVLTSTSLQGYIFTSIILVSVFIVGFSLIGSVLKAAEQKEGLTHLAASLEKANRRLKNLDRQKTEFLSIASHQLRTPLSIIKGYLELIVDGAYGKVKKELREVLNDMDESNERLVKLVDEFLNISRIEQGRTCYVFEESNMNTLILSVVHELTDRAKSKGIKIHWKKCRAVSKVYMDDEKVRHIIFNFIDNAIKYSDEGIITVLLSQEKGGASIHILDEGVGFDPDEEAAFFHKFYRGKNVEATNVNGTGLGIYVCKKFAEAHGGHVWAHSQGIGKGSEFGFWIPLERGKAHKKAERERNSKKQRVVNQYTLLEKEYKKH